MSFILSFPLITLSFCPLSRRTRTQDWANWAGTRFRVGLSLFSLGDARTAETTEGWLVVQDCAKKKEYVDACSFTLKSIKFLFTWPSTSGAETENISKGGFKISRVLRVETWPNSDRRFYPDRKQWQQIGRQAISCGLP